MSAVAEIEKHARGRACIRRHAESKKVQACARYEAWIGRGIGRRVGGWSAWAALRRRWTWERHHHEWMRKPRSTRVRAGSWISIAVEDMGGRMRAWKSGVARPRIARVSARTMFPDAVRPRGDECQFGDRCQGGLSPMSPARLDVWNGGSAPKVGGTHGLLRYHRR